MRQWYAVQSKPRQEVRAQEQLLRQNYFTYLPKILRRKRLRDKWTEVVEPLFPGYLFIHADPDEQSLAPVRSTLGVIGLVRFGQLLRPIPEEVIAYLKQAEDQQSHIREDLSCPHKPGDPVAILEGPFAGLSAIYQMPQPEQRALLLIELLGRPNEVIVDLNNLDAP